jgi:trimethylamine:corrinoid methyltransferase-like protein
MVALTEQDLHRIHDVSLEILEGNGVTFHENPEAINVLQKHGCRVDGFLVRFPRQVVEDCLGHLPDRNQLSFDYAPLGVTEPMSLKKGETHVGLIGNGRQVPDSRQSATREV